MKIALCNGGLGNQVFQYIFSRYIELVSGEACYLDDSVFWGEKVEHNGFEIPKVFPNAKPRLLSSFFTEDVWMYMLEQRRNGKSICQQIADMGEEIVMVAETGDYKFTGKVVSVPVNSFQPVLARCEGNIYYHGYWITGEWLKSDYYEVIKKELEFAPLTEEHNLRYAEQMKSCCSVSLHIRRGDFVRLNRAESPEEYKEVVAYAESILRDAEYFVFSDDLEWCKENMADLGLDVVADRVHFVEGNKQATSYRDMQLMTFCGVNILLGSSSFSYLAILLNSNPDKMVINATTRKI